MYAPLDRAKGIKIDNLRMNIRKVWLNIDLRNETRLKKAGEECEILAEEADDLVAKDYHELVQCHKLRNYVLCSKATADAALARRETRLEHIRDDYPLTDNKHWLKWVVSRLVENGLQTYLEDLPIERWKYRPEPTVVNRLRLKGEVT